MPDIIQELADERSLHVTEIAGLGAALTAGIGAGVYADAQAACDATASLRTGDCVQPVPEWAETCGDLYQRYEQLYPAMKPLFRAGS